MSMKPVVKFAISLLVAGALPALADSGDRDRAEPAERDCAPMNGTLGYYGNLWCDGFTPDHEGATISFERAPDGTVISEKSYRGRVLDRRVIRR
jgi:hypothetical protein